MILHYTAENKYESFEPNAVTDPTAIATKPYTCFCEKYVPAGKPHLHPTKPKQRLTKEELTERKNGWAQKYKEVRHVTVSRGEGAA